MKLDRNTNRDGKGKYALINLRTNKVEWGGDDMFFVIKYKDKFAEAALRAYANAVLMERDTLKIKASANPSGLARQIESLTEYAIEILKEADLAAGWEPKKIPD